MKKGLHCPKCKTYLNLPKQIKELDMDFGDDVELGAEFPWMSAIRCEKCDDTVALIFIQPTGEPIKVYSPALKGDVEIPTPAAEDELRWN